jgi:hypothetical protein
MMSKIHWRELAQLCRLPPAHSEDPSLDRKRKRVEELLSSSTSASKTAVGEPSAPNDDIEIFDLLDS